MILSVLARVATARRTLTIRVKPFAHVNDVTAVSAALAPGIDSPNDLQTQRTQFYNKINFYQRTAIMKSVQFNDIKREILKLELELRFGYSIYIE